MAAADAIKGILGLAGFPEIEVAFRESEVTQSVAAPKFFSFNPLTDPIPKFRKPFTPTLGLVSPRLVQLTSSLLDIQVEISDSSTRRVGPG